MTLSLKGTDLSAQRAALLTQLLDAEGGEAEEDRRIPRRKSPDIYPLSSGQQRMWLLDQFEKGTHYNEDFDLRLKGTVDIPVLRSVLKEIFRRHEPMRSTFTLVDGEVVQRPLPVGSFELPVIDLSEFPGLSREAEAYRLALEEVKRPFDLSKDPLWRFTLLLLSDEESILLITAHHVAIDGWSRYIFKKEFFALYGAFQAGKPSPLHEPVIQYSDYGAWQTEWLKSEDGDRQRTYWSKELANAPHLLELPMDRPRPPAQSFRGARYYLKVPKQLSTAMKALGVREGVTLFMTLMAAFNTLIKRYTEKDEIVIGAPVANRSHPEVEELIGFFVNTIALRTNLSGDPSFRELLQRVRLTMIAGLGNQALPFDQLVELLHPERTEAYTPLVQVLLVLEHASGSGIRLPGLSASDFKIDNGTSKFDLSLYIADNPDGLFCTFEYNTDLFSVERIERFAGHFQVLLEGVVRDPSQRLSELPILTAEERNRLLVEWNDNATEYPRETPLAQLVEAQVERTPDALAVAFGEERLTFRELNSRANRLACELQKRGAGPGKLVGIYVGRSTGLVVALLAIIKSGAAYLPMDPLFPAERLLYMLEDSGARLLVTERSLRETLPTFDGTAILMEDSSWQTNPDDNLSIEVGPEHLAYLIYTSGSTGKPKGVQVPRGALTNFLWTMRNWLELSERDRILAVTTISFDIAGLEIWLPLIVGAQTVVASRESASDGTALQDLLERHDITFLQATPVTWKLLFDAGWRGKQNLQAVCGGEAMPQEVAVQLVPAVKQVWNLYGPTETTIWSTGYWVTDGREPILIGRPFFNTQCYILDGRGQPVPAGVTGELHIAGDGLALGYLNRPELTAEKFVADPFVGGGARMYRTGDLARYRPDGNIECLGRIDHQVKIRGYRIELGEIETRLAEYPGVREAVVIAREDVPGEKRLVAYYAVSALGASEESKPGAEQFRAYLGASLPEYMVPAAYVCLEGLPLTPNGKIDRKALPAPDANAFSSRGYEPPQDETEMKLAAIWSEVLKLDQVGRHDDFFDLGGHSLMAVQAVTLMNREFAMSLPVRVLFQANTISQLASLIGKQRGTESEDWSALIPIQSRGERIPLFCVARPNVNALGYLMLSRELGNDQPVYGLQVQLKEDPAIDFSDEQYRNTAAEYIRAIKSVQAEGPYNLIGQCQGAYIAFEMVRQLEARGEEVASLGVLDVWIEENTRYRWRFIAHLTMKKLQAIDGRIVEKLSNRLRSRFSARSTPEDPATSPKTDSTPTMKRLFQKYFPGKDFVPLVCSAPITVYRVGEQPWFRKKDETMGWSDRTDRSVKVRNIAGDHLTIMRQPQVHELASMVAENFDLAGPRGGKELCKELVV